MERCPNCRARRDGDATCRRCGMELAGLIEVEQAAERLTALGVAHLVAGDPEAAKGDLTRVLGLRREPFAELLLGFSLQLRAEQQKPVLGASPNPLSPGDRFYDS